MSVSLGRIVIYTHKIDSLADFYANHFGFKVLRHEGDRIVELGAPGAGATILLHPAAKGQRQGQSLVKLVFDVKDVQEFCTKAAQRGLIFGSIRRADGYEFANAKDPTMNSIQVSSRAFAA